MSEELWQVYDEISDKRYILISFEKNGFYVINRETGRRIEGPFDSAEETALHLIKQDEEAKVALKTQVSPVKELVYA